MAKVVRRARTKAEPKEEKVEVVEDVVEEVAQEAAEKPAVDDADRIIARYRERATSPLKAIRAKCVECMGGYIAEISRCTSTLCPLYPLRMGKNTFHALAKTGEE